MKPLKNIKFILIAISIFMSLQISLQADSLSVKIVSPTNGATFDACSDIEITAEVTKGDANIRRVYYTRNGVNMSSASSEPYLITFRGAGTGVYELIARVNDGDGNNAYSEPVTITVGNPDPTNLIVNGEFDCATTPWRLDNYDGAVSSMEIDPEAFVTDNKSGLFILIDDSGPQTWSIQLMQDFVLKAGHTYEVSFAAIADDDKQIQITFSQDYDPWASYYWEDIMLTDADTYYGPYTFECINDDDNVMFKFVIGYDNIALWLDAVRVVDLSDTTATAVEIAIDNEMLNSFELEQNYPNPFNPETTIRYSLEKPGLASIKIFNLKGDVVFDYSKQHTAGQHELLWNGKDKLGNGVASGVYIAKLSVGNYSKSIKMQLLK